MAFSHITIWPSIYCLHSTLDPVIVLLGCNSAADPLTGHGFPPLTVVLQFSPLLLGCSQKDTVVSFSFSESSTLTMGTTVFSGVTNISACWTELK